MLCSSVLEWNNRLKELNAQITLSPGRARPMRREPAAHAAQGKAINGSEEMLKTAMTIFCISNAEGIATSA